jgi:acyl-CoA dehydrogenase
METQAANKKGREALAEWLNAINKNVYRSDKDYIHTIKYYFPANFERINAELDNFGHKVSSQLDPLVAKNHLAGHLPRLESYTGIGERIDNVVHDLTYQEAGEVIYGTGLMGKIATPGHLLEGLSLFFLSSQAGEAGHNCPIACSAGIILSFLIKNFF